MKVYKEQVLVCDGCKNIVEDDTLRNMCDDDEFLHLGVKCNYCEDYKKVRLSYEELNNEQTSGSLK